MIVMLLLAALLNDNNENDQNHLMQISTFIIINNFYELI